MNIEKIVNKLGRIVGQYHAGLKGALPSVNDPSAWMDGRYWGEGIAGGRKPMNKAEFVDQFQSWVYTCANLNAKTIAAVPIRLYVTKTGKAEKFTTISTKSVDGKGKKWLEANAGLDRYLRKAEDVEEVTEHPFLDLMNNVNPFANANDLWETTSLFQDLTGEAYWYTPKKPKLGIPGEIWVIPSPFINPVPGESLDNFIKGYRYERGRVKVDLPIEDVIMFSFPNPKNQIQGWACVQGISDAVYINSKMYEFEKSLFENKARVSGVVTIEGNVSEQARDRFQRTFDDKYVGAKKAGKTIVLTGGAKFNPDTMSPQELSYIEGRKLIREEICAGFDVPISALVATDVNRANAETADYRHAKNGILPRLRKIEQKLNERLIPLYDTRLFVAFDNPVPEDKEFLLKQNQIYVDTGIVTRDEVRQEIGQDVRGGLSDVQWVNTMTKPIDVAGEPPQPPMQFGPNGGNGNGDEEKPGKEDEEADAEELAGKVLEAIKRKLA